MRVSSRLCVRFLWPSVPHVLQSVFGQQERCLVGAAVSVARALVEGAQQLDRYGPDMRRHLYTKLLAKVDSYASLADLAETKKKVTRAGKVHDTRELKRSSSSNPSLSRRRVFYMPPPHPPPPPPIAGGLFGEQHVPTRTHITALTS